MEPLELIVIAVDALFIILFITFPHVFASRKEIANYLYENPGAPLIILFVMFLLMAAIYFTAGNYASSNEFSEISYFLLLIGIILQALSERFSKAVAWVFKKLLRAKDKITKHG